MRRDHLKQLRPHIRNRAHQQPPGAPARYRKPVRTRIAERNQMLRARDKIVERVPLLQQFPVLIPAPPQVPRSANMRDGEHKTPVEQAHPFRHESRFRDDPVRAIAIQIQRIPAIALQPLPPHQRNRHLHPVRSRGKDPFGNIVRRIITTQYLDLFLQFPLPRVHVVRINRARSDQRTVSEAELRGRILFVALRQQCVDRLVETHEMFVAGSAVENPQTLQTIGPFGHHKVIFEAVHLLQRHLLAMRNYLRPSRGRWIFTTQPQQPEIPPVLIGPDIKPVRLMFHEILDILPTFPQ